MSAERMRSATITATASKTHRVAASVILISFARRRKFAVPIPIAPVVGLAPSKHAAGMNPYA